MCVCVCLYLIKSGKEKLKEMKEMEENLKSNLKPEDGNENTQSKRKWNMGHN